MRVEGRGSRVEGREGMTGYRDLAVWNKGMDLATLVYAVSKHLPKEEQFRLTSQLLRAAASVPANLAEGYQRSTRRDYANFVSIARGSLAETETFLLLAERAGLLSPDRTRPALALAEEVSRMLTRLRLKLEATSGGDRPSTLDPRPSTLAPGARP